MLQSVTELYTSLGAMVTNLGSTPNRDVRDKLLFVRAQAMVVLITGLGTKELLSSIPWCSVADMLRYSGCGHMLRYSGCGHMLRYSGGCGHVLRYSGCGHMLRYSGGCGHMLGTVGVVTC